jgi:branched-chain amino acid transport system ATP-binding protein
MTTMDARAATPTTADAVLTLQNVSVSYGGIQALAGIDLTVCAHEFVAVIGPNGAGKSTLLNAVSGLSRSTVRGSIEMFGQAVSNQRADRVARLGIGRSFQDPPLIDEATVLENVLGGAHLKLGYSTFEQLWRRRRVRRQEAAWRDEAMSILQLCALDTAADKKAGSLPYGSRKLVDIARAFVAGPDLVLLDEPTSGLDNAGQQRVVSLLAAIRARQNPAMLVVEHHMHLVRAIADRVAGLQAGSVIAVGTPAEVLDSAEFRAAVVGGSQAEQASQAERQQQPGRPTPSRNE